MKILNHFDSTLFESEEATTPRECLKAAVGANATLSGAQLVGEKLTGVDFRGANLAGANLAGSDLRGSSFVRAGLYGADFSGADLRHATLAHAELDHALFAGARINWQSHDLISALLNHEAGNSIGKRKVAGLILVSRDWCWDSWSELGRRQPRHFAWALGVLARYVHPEDEDEVPTALWDAYLKRYAESEATVIPDP
jgi:hypothetical protein